MGTCIICGADVEGHVCSSHEQDVCFEFTGSRPGQLTEGRYYRGTVDGYADFGVFIDVGDHVTGLLHTSELDRRLESLDWEPGDSVYVQVQNVRDNGNVDLGWSIRQRDTEFRGKLIETPEGDQLPEESEEVSDEGPPTVTTRKPGQLERDDSPPSAENAGSPEPTEGDGGTAVAVQREFEAATIAELADRIGDPVRIEGRIVEARQTSGPTIFEVRDQTGAVECAAFESAGVRAYPDVEEGDVVRLEGIVEERRGDVQVETESLEALEGEERAAVDRQLEEAIAERARPDSVELLGDDPAIDAIREEVVSAAEQIRRAVFEGRPVIIRHAANVDGYVGAAALEHAVLPLVREEQDDHDAEYHYIDRRPIDGRVYGLGDALRDVTRLLEAGERHDEPVPLFVFVGAAGTDDSSDGLDLLGTYDAGRIVIDGNRPDETIADVADVFVNPHLAGATANTAAIAANVAAHVANVRDDISHLPAVSYWRDVPATYERLATEAGYDAADVETVRQAIALEAFYQVYDDKRELIADILFGEQTLAERASEQFRDRVDDELRTAEPHVETWKLGGPTVATLDLAAYTHGYEFPPATLLLSELAERVEADAVLGIDEDELLVWSETPVDMRTVATAIDDAVPQAGVETRGGVDGTISFLSGEREAVIQSALDAIGEQL